MNNRRNFMKGAMAAGLAFTAGPLLTACASNPQAFRRETLPDNCLPFLDGPEQEILHLASLAPSGHNSQPWRVRVAGPGRWIVEADPARRLPAVDPENRELLLSLGAFVENFSLAAGALGFRVEAETIAEGRGDRDIVRISLIPDRRQPFPVELMRLRRTVKTGQASREISSRDIKALFQHMDGLAHYFSCGSQHASCIRDATVEAFRAQSFRDDAQEELVRWLRLSNRSVKEHRDGLTVAGMEISGMTGWYLRNFGKPEVFLKKSFREQGADLAAKTAAEGAGWIIITSRGDSVSDLMETGRRFERMALEARALGIGIHPMTQVLEEATGQDAIAASHGRPMHLQFVLRVGYVEKYPKPVSPRRSLPSFVRGPGAV
ncbi:nitroreductase [Desulfatibacillum aliphaticivorans]|uniref:Nitroreductase n=1 Tax=Desulfatibacillum aliphaticivorans TaxID=218208 RepID=B8FIN5_DESAL|nr:nitroreductase [Desulfatibacillum aliphaticivorans]ACL04025.1 nitroreductase [Desulfatibacillum aliphaticivorans]